MEFFLKISRKIGIDSTVAYTVISRIWQSSSGLISIFVFAQFLLPEEQGFYFTFASIIALQVFVELGFSAVIVQCVSHECANLNLLDCGILVGPRQYRDRLASFMKLILKWYGVATLLIIILLLPSGYVFFLKQQAKYAGIVWQSPWFCLVLSFSIFFYLSPLLCFLEGCGRMKEVAKMRFIQDLVANLLLWGGCFGKISLWVAPLCYAGRSLVVLLWVGTSWRRRFFTELLASKPQTIVDWRNEVFPFQWRMALSWVSGYFIFQLFNPVLFVYHGAVVAGQMGLSLSACNSIAAIAIAWINTKTPVFGNLIAKKRYVELDELFFRILKQSFVVILFLVVCFIVMIYFLQLFQPSLGGRFLPILPLLLLNGALLINHLSFSQAAYLRAHKREPLLVNSIIMACLMGLSTYFLGRFYSAAGIACGYFVLTCFGLIWVTMVFLQKRRIWHC